VELAPDNYLFRYHLANARLALQSFREAAQEFKAVIALNPEHARSYLGLGQAYGELGDNEQARQCFVKAKEVATEDTDRQLADQLLASLP